MILKRNRKFILLGFSLLVFASAHPAVAALEVYRIVTNYPNPFDSRQENTTILYALGIDAEVKARIYDLFGNPVKEYQGRMETAGIKRIVWDGTDDNGYKVAKGGYICVVEIKSGGVKTTATRKIGVVH